MEYRRLRHIATFLTCFVTTMLPMQAAQAEVDWASVTWHNDLFSGRDGGGYTNGLYISWYDLSSEGDDEVEPPLLTRPLTWMQNQITPLSYSVNTIGQSMITPTDITKENPDPDDAPYAGLLFFRSTYILVHDNYADAVSTVIGVIGPASGAEKTQQFVHKLTGSNEPRGWDHQLGNEIVGQVSRTGVWRFSPREFSPVDAVLLGNVSLGNLESSVGGGLILRAGSGLSKSFSTVALLTGRISNPVAVDNGWYFYMGAAGDYLYNQIYMNGNTFKDSPSADLRHDQYTLIAGFSYAWSDISLSFSYQKGSPLDKGSSARQEFGALTLAWRL